uniref:Uncharacterized protein n=1 Tax=Cucumis melo TaxID=3656 RepID=A0A9I9EK59_CUCME
MSCHFTSSSITEIPLAATTLSLFVSSTSSPPWIILLFIRTFMDTTTNFDTTGALSYLDQAKTYSQLNTRTKEEKCRELFNFGMDATNELEQIIQSSFGLVLVFVNVKLDLNCDSYDKEYFPTKLPLTFLASRVHLPTHFGKFSTIVGHQ